MRNITRAVLRTDTRSGTARFNLIGWLGFYKLVTPGTSGSVRACIRVDEDTIAQPAVLLRVLETCGGQCRATHDDYLEGSPELIAEVADTTADEDLGPKRELYRRMGVQEYIVYRVADRAVDWFVLRKGYYFPLDPGADGIIRSEVFPGLWLDTAALIRGDGPRVLAVAQQGHGSAEHTAFLQELARRAVRPV